jgi:hypothetical protein
MGNQEQKQMGFLTVIKNNLKQKITKKKRKERKKEKQSKLKNLL